MAGIYGGAWTGPVFVLTHRPDDTPDDPAVTFLSGDLREAVASVRDAAAGKNVEIFGANTAQGCLDAGLLDELVIHVAPVLLGAGVRLYGEPGASARVELARTDAADPGEAADLRLSVVK